MSFPTPYSHHYDHHDHYAITPETTTTTTHARLFVCSPEHLHHNHHLRSRHGSSTSMCNLYVSIYVCVYRYSRSSLHSSKVTKRILDRPRHNPQHLSRETPLQSHPNLQTKIDLQLQNISTIYPAMRRECPRRCAADFSSGRHIYTRRSRSTLSLQMVTVIFHNFAVLQRARILRNFYVTTATTLSHYLDRSLSPSH